MLTCSTSHDSLSHNGGSEKKSSQQKKHQWKVIFQETLVISSKNMESSMLRDPEVKCFLQFGFEQNLQLTNPANTISGVKVVRLMSVKHPKKTRKFLLF